jgi:hypothetical protein
MPATLSICVDCERQALRRPKRGRAITEALVCLVRLLGNRRQLQGLEVLREPCLQNCPVGRICVALKQDGQEVRHHLDPKDDLRAVVAKLAGTAKS